MKNLELKELLKQHEDSYRNSLIEIIKNNTNSLVDQDLVSVLQKPPLDSMDLLRMKLLELAKKNKIVFQTPVLDSMLEKYRSYLLSCCVEIKKDRISDLCFVVKKYKLKQSTEIIKINKKDFMSINKKIKKILKDQLNQGFHSIILDSIDELLIDCSDETHKTKIISDLTKYMNGFYQKQILENCELKTMVKDTTLMNAIKEQSDRYLFTLNHSHLLNQIDA